MLWVELFAVFAVSHMVGDYVLQTNWQALHKYGGLGRTPEARRALVGHLTTYTLAFVPALIWIGDERGVGIALASAAGIALPHLVQDDGRLLTRYMHAVKKLDTVAEPTVAMLVDQSVHAVAMLIAALLIAS